MYGTEQKEPDVQVAYCERADGHPPVSTDKIGHWRRGDKRLDKNPDSPANAPRRIDRRQEEIVRDRLREIFGREARLRIRRPDTWADEERKAMLAEVNNMRTLLGRPPASMEAIEAADSMAAGHSDYYLKFPLYCMDVVFDRAPRL